MADRIAGRVYMTSVYLDAGMPGYGWHVIMVNADGTFTGWARVFRYATRSGAHNGLARWRDSRTTRGMVEMNELPQGEVPEEGRIR